MVLVPEHVKNMLKKPLDEVHASYERIKVLSRNYRIISVGDITTLALLAIGIRPHLAVFDHMVMRKRLMAQNTKMLELAFRNARRFKNRQGTISGGLLRSAGVIVREGGAVLIEGEEDLTALAFIRHADNKTIVMYGQPNVGVVVVMPTKKTKEMIEKIFALILGKKMRKKQRTKMDKTMKKNKKRTGKRHIAKKKQKKNRK